MGGCCGRGCGDDEDHDPSNGPIKNRSCTDIPCCLFYFVFLVGYVIIAIFAWLNGDPRLIINPTDNQGRICGINYKDYDLSSKTSVIYFDITKCAQSSYQINSQCTTTQVCVTACPTENWSYVPDLIKSDATVNWTKYICTYGFDARENVKTGVASGKTFQVALKQIMDDEKCAPYYVQSSSVAGRCIPSIVSTTANATLAGIRSQENGSDISYDQLNSGSKAVQIFMEAQSIAENILSDFTSTWYWILVAVGISAVVCLFWIFILRWIAGIIVWGTIFALIGVLIFGTVFTYNQWQTLSSTSSSSNTNPISLDISSSLSTYTQNATTWLVIFIICAVLCGIILLVVLFLRKRIDIAIAVIKESTKAVIKMLSTVFYPLATVLLCSIMIAFWLSTALFLASAGDPVYKLYNTTSDKVVTGTCNSTSTLTSDQKCVFTGYGGESFFHQNIIWLQLYCGFGFLWIINWILALGECSLAGAFASYYWAFDKSKDIPMFPLAGGFARSIRYHTGSLAFGALIISIVQAIRILLEYLETKLKAAENSAAKCLFRCLKCCFYCVEKILKFINRNAYIMIAIYGRGFCCSAKEAFKLLVRNILRAVVLDKITDFIFFIGKLVVTVGMGALAWAFLSNKITIVNEHVPDLNYYWFTIFVIAFASYIVASAFFGTCSMAVDTIFLCFLEDLERHDGSPKKPYYMSKSLMKVLGKKNKKKKTVEEAAL